MLTDFQNCYIE